VVAAEWFTGSDPGAGSATTMTVSGTGPWNLSATIDVGTWTGGTYTLFVRARDAAGNWGATSSTDLVVDAAGQAQPIYFSMTGNVNPPGVSGSADNADIYSWDATGFNRVFDGSAEGLAGSANIDGYDHVDATHFYMSFVSDGTTLPGLGAVEDEDVVYYDNGTWSVFFDGTALGLTASGHDLDAINIVGGILYFSTVGNINPPGVTGSADNADIYSWDGSSFARVWDATANGVEGNANVDGFVRVDASHFYLSFNNTTTTLPGLGTVADVNILFNNIGTWETFFDGSAQGLTAGTGQDLDAFDIP
jgi:hypothetical protein